MAVLALQRDLIAPTNNADADMKSCGPDLPVLRSAIARKRCRNAMKLRFTRTGAIEPVPGEQLC